MAVVALFVLVIIKYILDKMELLMFAASRTTEYPAMAAGQQYTSRAQCMPDASTRTRRDARTMCGQWATASAAASILLLRTGVLASVSLFVLILIIGSLFLVSLVGLLSLLTLSGLTRQLISLVGLIKGLSPGATTGE